MKSISISRRTFMKTALGALGLGGLTHYGYTTFDLEDFLSSTLNRLLGEVNITDAHMSKFCNDFADSYGHKKLYIIIILEQTSVFDRIAEKLFLFFSLAHVGEARWIVEKFERKLLTQFIISTSYLRVDNPATDTIKYHRINIPCNNPFAKFEFDTPSISKQL